MTLATTGAQAGIATAYGLNTAVPIDIDEAIYTLSYDDAPMILGINSDGHQILPTKPVSNTEFDWLEEERLTPVATIDTAISADTTTTVELTNAGDAYRFEVGEILQFEGSEELMRVASITDSDTIEVTREFAGTTYDGPYAVDAKVYGHGVLLPEGSDPGDSRTADRAKQQNYTQIFGPSKVEMSRTEQGRAKYGVANEFTHQIMNRMKEDVQRRERALLYGVKYQDTGARLRMSGGLKYWIPTANRDTGTGSITVSRIEALMQTNYNKGGVPNILTANPASMGSLNDLDGNGRVRTDFADGRRGRQPVTVVWTEYGPVTILRNRYVNPNDAFMWTREQAGRRVFDPVRLERLAKTGDADKMQMVCEEGLWFKGAEHASAFTGLTNA